LELTVLLASHRVLSCAQGELSRRWPTYNK
jgi:hypothetical protein